MIKTLIFECINIDTLTFNAGEMIPAGKSHELFVTEDNGIEDYVTGENEEQILKWLIDKAGGLLLNKLHLSQDALIGFSVRRPVVENHNLPDIDILLCEHLFPQFSVGIQCKRVKVQSINEDKEINFLKLQKLYLRRIYSVTNLVFTEIIF